MSAQPHFGSVVAPSGDLHLRVVRNDQTTPAPAVQWPLLSWRSALRHGLPADGLPDHINRWRVSNMRNLMRGARRMGLARALGLPHISGELWLTKIRGDGTVEPYGLASLRVVTDTGVGYIVDAFQNIVELENMKYHGFGTGGAAEAVGNTGLTTELTTQYAVDSTRPTGTTTEFAANIYQTVATLSPDTGGTIAVTEHGVFSAASAGVLLDRSLFSAVNIVAASDSLQADYRLTLTSGS